MLSSGWLPLYMGQSEVPASITAVFYFIFFCHMSVVEAERERESVCACHTSSSPPSRVVTRHILSDVQTPLPAPDLHQMVIWVCGMSTPFFFCCAIAICDQKVTKQRLTFIQKKKKVEIAQNCGNTTEANYTTPKILSTNKNSSVTKHANRRFRLPLLKFSSFSCPFFFLGKTNKTKCLSN